MSVIDPKRTLAYHALGICSPRLFSRIILSSRLSQVAKLRARLTARSQRAPSWGRPRRMGQAALSVAGSEALEALAGRI